MEPTNKENVENLEQVKVKTEKKMDKPATSRTFLKFMAAFALIMVAFVIFFVRSNNSSFRETDKNLQKQIDRDSALIGSQGNDLIRHEDSIVLFSSKFLDLESRVSALENKKPVYGNYASKNDLSKTNSRVDELENDVSILRVNSTTTTTVVDNTTTNVVKKTSKKKNPCAGLSEEECEELMAQIEADAEDAAAQKEADAESQGEE